MTNLLNGLNTVLTSGIGGIAFLSVWTYAVLRWIGSMGLWDGDWNGFGGITDWWF
jgi:hypothetical protein